MFVSARVLVLLVAGMLAEGVLASAAASNLTPGARILQYLHSRSEGLHITTPQPVKAVYIDWRDVNWNDPSQNVKAIADAGFNVIILAFLLVSGPTDMLQAWASLPVATRTAAVSYCHSKGAVVMLSSGGATESPFSQDATSYGTAAANAAVSLNLDGVDFDLENLGQGCVFGSMSDSDVVSWMVTATVAARSVLGPAPFITHAPQAPYFGIVGGGSGNPWPGASGCYTGLYLKASSAISWFNMQFYNQGSTCYTSYTSLFLTSNGNGACPPFPGTSVREIVSYGVPESAVVIGKPLDSGDAGNGYVAPADLHSFFANATAHQMSPPGVMAWSWDSATSAAWIAAVYPPSQ